MTAFSPDNLDFTKSAHLAAQEQIYPKLFPNASKLQFIDTVGATEDLKYGIDCIVAVTVDGFRAPLKFFMQERWRAPKYIKRGDITVTEWNTQTDLPSELYKIAAHIFLYGYYERSTNRIVEAIAVNVPKMLLGLSDGEIKYSTEERLSKDQDFIGINWEELIRNHSIMLSTIHDSIKHEVMTQYETQRGEKWD